MAFSVLGNIGHTHPFFCHRVSLCPALYRSQVRIFIICLSAQPLLTHACDRCTICLRELTDTGVFTAAGYIHWGYTVPTRGATFSFAVAWNMFPRFRSTDRFSANVQLIVCLCSACFPIAVSFRAYQREFVQNAQRPPRAFQHFGATPQSRPFKPLAESFNLGTLCIARPSICMPGRSNLYIA